MSTLLKEAHKIHLWSNDEIIEELSRPVSEPLNVLQKMVEREALARILSKFNKGD